LRAYHEEIIRKPILSLAYRVYSLNGALTLGAEEPEYCTKQWIYHEANDQDWVLKASQFEFNELLYEKKVKVRSFFLKCGLELLKLSRFKKRKATFLLYMTNINVSQNDLCPEIPNLSF
jgi:hypothetical protein